MKNTKILTERQQFPMVDIIKFICALLVVAIHISPVSSYSDNGVIYKYMYYGIKYYVTRIAVPFYFAASGFFFCRKINFETVDMLVIKNYIFKLLRFLGVWTILLFAGGTYHLWYIGGLVAAVCLFSVMLYKKVPLYLMVIIAIILYIIGLMGDPYYGLLCHLQKYKILGYLINEYFAIFTTTRNGIFMGFPFFLLGGIIAKKKICIKPCYAIFGFLLSMGLLFCEAVFLKVRAWPKDVNMYIFLVPAVFFLLLFSVNVSVRPRSIYKKMRNVGVIVYFSHLFVYQLILWGFEFTNKFFNIKIENSLIYYFLTIIIATALGAVIDELSQNKKFRFLKYLYS